MRYTQCMKCGLQYCDEDAEMLRRDNVISLCDDCEYEDIEMEVEYDGSEDLLDHLKKHIRNNRVCSNCLINLVELERISFGNPIEAYIHCTYCKMEDEMDIILIMT